MGTLCADVVNHFEEITPRIGEEANSKAKLWHIVGFTQNGDVATFQFGDRVIDALHPEGHMMETR